MGRLIASVKKDLARAIAKPLAPLCLLAFPILFAGLLALAFAPSNSTGIPKAQLLIADEDGGLGSQLLKGALTSEQLSELIELTAVSSEQGLLQLEENEASALLIVPEGFTDAILEGEETTLRFVRNPAQSILPEIAEQVLSVLVTVIESGGRVLREPLDQLVGMGDEAPSEAEVIAMSIMVRSKLLSSEQYIFPPVIQLESTTEEDPAELEEEPNSTSTIALIFGTLLPGLTVFAMLMLGDHTMRDVLVEGRQGTLRRQLQTTLSVGEWIIGKGLYTGLITGLGGAILFTLARLSLAKPVDVVPFVVLGIALTIMVVGLTALIYGLCKNERQGSTIATAVFLFLGFLGGGFLPIDNLPAALIRLLPFNPFAWGVQGFQAVLMEQAGLSVVVMPALKLLIIGLIAGGLGVLAIRRNILSGAFA